MILTDGYNIIPAIAFVNVLSLLRRSSSSVFGKVIECRRYRRLSTATNIRSSMCKRVKNDERLPFDFSDENNAGAREVESNT